MIRIIQMTTMIFANLSVSDILDVMNNPHVNAYKLPFTTFKYLANRTIPELTNDELYNLFERIKVQISEETSFLRCAAQNNVDGIDVFDLLLIISNYLLDESYGTPLCKYEHILLWRRASLELDEDLYITAFLAYKDIIRPVNNRSFCWKPVIPHDNSVLQTVMNRGVAENHFHLTGSSQSFGLSWINIMNHPESRSLIKELNKIDKNRLNHEHTMPGKRNEPLYLRCFKAAAIRLYLFLYTETGKFSDQLRPVIIQILSSDAEVMPNVNLQNIIDSRAFIYGMYEEYDYALPRGSSGRELNGYYAGERQLLYKIIKEIYAKGHNCDELACLLHIYVLLKESVRSEIIQNNDVMGFGNFQEYQNRKLSLIDTENQQRLFYRIAIADTLTNMPYIRKLEARIAPGMTAGSIYRYIDRIDECIKESVDDWVSHNDYDRENSQQRLLERYFYTLNFIKSPEKLSNLESFDLCRHSGLREKIKKQAFAIISFRENYPQTARRVMGIDAASSEIGCRPEVFAHTFRTLRNHELNMSSINPYQLPRLGVTYHVGEDFVDVIDGLRAIDEALQFFNMSCGDRLGHALALGTDVYEWYSMKNWVITISQQDYLDNVAWMFSKIIEFNINVDSSLMFYLENEFHKYFRIIYRDHMSEDYLEYVSRKSGKFYDKTDIELNIDTYYNAWKLRGDSPENYAAGYYRAMNYTDEWDRNAENRLFPADKSIRTSPAVTFLYHTYHYNADVKLEGNKKIKVEIPRQLATGIELIQKKLQKIIAYKGICIETNPSSNCLIGSFGKYSYEKHPILRFYNIGLERTDKMSDTDWGNVAVCINTDDQSVFKTSIENEYALLVRALESAHTDNGTHKYGRVSVYDWIDNIRRMGLDYSFKKDTV